MTRFRLIFTCLLLSTFVCAQNEKVETEISSPRVFDLSIIRVYPDSFPNVSVIFQAKNKLGKPLWLLSKDELRINENNQECKVISLRDISKNKPLNIAMVLDHSGSMVDNPAQMPDSVETYQYLYFDNALPKDYVMPIDYAKKAIFDFCNTSETLGDSLLFVSFSSEVDTISPLTGDFRSIQELIKEIKPDGGTAFYDALYATIDALDNHASQPVIIALTDGEDNGSTHTLEELVKHAIDKNVVIYAIGLGRAETQVLEHIAENTKGFYYYTNDPASLAGIYSNIKQQLKSIYQVDYVSTEMDDPENGGSNQNVRRIEFVFKNDTLTFSENSNEYTLPEEAIKYLKEQDEIRKAKITKEHNEQLLLYGSIGGAILFGMFTFIVIRKKRKSILELKKVFPNPFNDVITLEYNLPLNAIRATLNVTNFKGSIVLQQSISLMTSTTEFNVSELKKGTYLLQIETETEKSNTLKVVKK